MKEIMLTCVLAVYGLYGWLKMRKLDQFLEENWKKEEGWSIVASNKAGGKGAWMKKKRKK